mgnify:CR=1 FL=1
MIYTELTNRAMKLAYEAHMGQRDAGGLPYIFHPYHLAEQMDNETRTCIALLHDVVEDTSVTMDQIKKAFPTEIVDALELLTHGEHVDYYEYVKKVCTNADAAFVKLADLVHNISEERLIGADIGIEKRDRWFQKYIWALHIVTECIENYLEEQCDYSRTGKTFYLYRHIMEGYKGEERRIVLCTDRRAEDYLTKEQYSILRNRSIEDQMPFFDIRVVSSCEGSWDKDYHRERTVSLKEFTDSYRYRQLITADGCIVGVMDTNLDLSHCKKAVQAFWVGRGERFCREKNWIDHSWDHYAAVWERESYRLRWK